MFFSILGAFFLLRNARAQEELSVWSSVSLFLQRTKENQFKKIYKPFFLSTRKKLRAKILISARNKNPFPSQPNYAIESLVKFLPGQFFVTKKCQMIIKGVCFYHSTEL